MQQRGINLNMEEGSEDKKSAPLSRGRTNSKLKVLVRSHAMREEASPPRDPSHLSLMSPCIKLIPSPSSSPSCSPTMSKPVVVLSPSISRGNSPCHSPQYISPTSTLVPSPISRSSSHEHMNTVKVQISNHEREGGDSGYSEGHRSSSPKYSVSRSLEETSQSSNRKKGYCDCTSQTCTNCLKSCERNFNNNLSSNINNNVVCSSNTLTVNRGFKSKLRQQSSSQGSFEGSSSNSPCLSRDSSSEQYTDTTGIDLEQFIAETLNRNGKDRALMLRIEQELVSLAKDKIKTHYKFPSMSSYQRMLVHRCAAYFGMDHNIESSGKCVVVNKTKSTRIPDIAFKEYIKEDIIFMEEPRRSILKRDSNSIEDYSFKSPDRQFSLENRRSKSFEEREEEYEKVRRRIFNKEMYSFGSAEEFGWSEIPWSSTESDYSARFRLLHSDRHPGRLLKVQSVEAGTDLPRAPCVAKSYSFGGYQGISVLTRGDSVLSTHSAGPRLLTKQDSGASTVSWRLSPSSSGYKSQSQISESVTPSPTSTPNPSYDSARQDSTNSNASTSTSETTDRDQSDSQLVWAVTDIHDVPKGSVIINPQTGQPVKNIDGTLYHYDPHNLPPGFSEPEPEPIIANPALLSHKLSPKKQRSKSSPTLNNKKNSSTSPSLPFSPPPLQQSRSINFAVPSETVQNIPPQQFHPVYGGNFNSLPAHDTSLPVYPQPYVVYAAYGVPVQPPFEGRLEPAVQEVPGSYFVTDTSANTGQQGVPCQSGAQYWNQQHLAVYQTAPPNPSLPQPLPPRYVVPVNPQPGTFIPPSFSSNYIPQASPGIQNIPQSSQNTDLIPIYPSQPVQVLYQTSQNPTNPIMYPNPSIVYTQNSPLFQNMVVPVHNVSYPSNSTSSNSTAQMQEQLGQLTLSPTSQSAPNILYNQLPPMGQSFDIRSQKSHMLKGNKFSIPKNMLSGSSQSSTGTSSPAATVIATSCSNHSNAPYRTPSETPPMSGTFSYGQNIIPPMMHRQIGNVHASPPISSSRSPTPASDISHIDHNRYPMPPTMFQGVSYVLQGDARMIPGRGHPANSRQPPPFRQHSFNSSGIDNSNKSYRNKKTRTNKMPSVPVTGK